jgi:hypothetical protein
MPDAREVRVKGDARAVIVRARAHTWVALAGEEGELARELGGAPETTFAVPGAGTYAVSTDGELRSAKAAEIAEPAVGAALLRLSSDAPDLHVVDGVGEIPADGTSSCALLVEKLDADGRPLRRRSDTDEVFLRTTGGTLRDDEGAHVRSLRLRAGRATVRLVSEATPRLVTIEAFGHPPLGRAELRVEFV